jgi:hypothetical protein
MKKTSLFRLDRIFTLGLALAAGLQTGCQTEQEGKTEPAVMTLNPGYNRLHSKNLVRRVRIPTEANLDYAAFSKNVLLADPEWHAVRPPSKVFLDSLKFNGLGEEVKAIIDFTPLTDAERAQPIAWTPALDHLLKWSFAKTSDLANAYSAVTSEKWGDTSDVSQSYQEFSAIYIHANGNLKEVWAELEFKPWIGSHLEGIMDKDNDKFPEVYLKLNPRLFTAEMADELLGDYASKVLPEAQVIDWARNLASHSYPQYNTDLVEIKPGATWPYDDATPNAKKDIGNFKSQNPLIIMKGHPYEDTMYYVIEVDGMGKAKPVEEKVREGVPVTKGLDKDLSRRLDTVSARLDAEVKKIGGGSWEAWSKQAAPFRAKVRAFGEKQPVSIQGLIAGDSMLVFRRELEYLACEQPKQNPIPVIAAFKDQLAAKGIDFLFIPIPTKIDVYPEVVTGDTALPGGIAQPAFRKLLRDLADARVETLDFLDAFLRIKNASETGKRGLYQRQDTHWTTVALEAGAQLVAERIKKYSWYDSVYSNKRDYKVRDSVFESLGDIQARLNDADKAKIAPEAVMGHQITDAQGNLYEDSDSSQVLVLGDSYTGVFQTVGCRHAGVTAHLAKQLGGPVDLIMGWGGGPEAPGKLKKRGDAYLDGKRLVVWMMSVRDLFVYPGEWTLP